MSLTPFDLVLIVLGSFGLTYGLVSGYSRGVLVNGQEINQAIASGQPPPDEIREGFYGQHSGFKGPFGLYTLFRWALDQPALPEWVQDGARCRICINLSTGAFVSIFALVDNVFMELVLYILASHGTVNMVFALARLNRGVLPNDW